jgi:hypothetical protein
MVLHRPVELAGLHRTWTTCEYLYTNFGEIGVRTIQPGFQPLPIDRQHRRYHRAVY